MRGSVVIVLTTVALLAGCSDEGSGEDTRFTGVVELEPVRIDEADVRDVPLPQRPFVVEQTTDDTLVVAYLAALRCSDEPWQQEPASVTAVFGPDTVSLTVDPVSPDCSGGEEHPFVGGFEVVLAEPVGNRAVEAWYAR